MIVARDFSWFQLLFRIRGSSLERIWRRVLFTTGVAILTTWLQQEVALFRDFNLTQAPFALIALPLGIFLGFRNSTSYDRYWEGRNLWGRLVNTSRSFTRQILTLVHVPELPSTRTLDDPEQPIQISEFHREISYRLIAYVHAFRMHLRNDLTLDYLTSWLPQAELESLKNEYNVPNAIVQRIGDRIQDAWRNGWVHTYHIPILEQSLTQFTEIQGGCERIKSTPIPFSYTVLIHRLVAIYCLFLPFGLASTTKMMTPLVVLFISYALFSLDAIGDELENPFGTDVNDLPLTMLSTMIEINIRQRVGDTQLPTPVMPDQNHSVL